MMSKPMDWPVYVDAMAALHKLPLDADRRCEVIRQLRAIESQAQQVMDFPLAQEIEPAPVFRP